MVYQAPPLLSTKTDSKLETELAEIVRKRDILERLIKGESVLAIAQTSGIPEREIRALLREAYSVQSEAMREEAPLLQQQDLARHEFMYRTAYEQAFHIDPETGEPARDEKTNKPLRPDINWFREMRLSLIERQKIIAPHLQQAGEEKHTEIRITITPDDQMYTKAQGIRHLADVRIEDIIQGRLTDGT